MKKLPAGTLVVSGFVALLLTLASGCSTSPATRHATSDEQQSTESADEDNKVADEAVPGAKFLNRAPASSKSSDEPGAAADLTTLEADFQKLLSSSSQELFQLRLQLRLDAVEEIYHRARSQSRRFDGDLDLAAAERDGSLDQFFNRIIKSGLYTRLLALRASQVSRQHQLAYFYQRFDQILREGQKDSEPYRKATIAFSYLGEYFRYLPMHYLVAHYELGLELDKLNPTDSSLRLGLSRMLYGKRGRTEQTKELVQTYLDLYERPEVIQKIEQVGKVLEGVSTPIEQRLEESVRSMQLELIAKSPTHSLQSDKIAPGTGPSGNVTGNGFPSGVWSITFDDGPHGSYTNKVLENLHNNGMTATFFMLAQNATEYPKIARRVLESGNETANHSWSHPKLTKLNDLKLRRQIVDSTQRLSEVIGVRPSLFRCPYGAGTSVPRVRALIAQQKMVHVFWNVDTLDWQDRNPNTILARAKKQMALSKKGGGVILFHDIHPQSVEASRMLMEHLSEKNKEKPGTYRIMPVGQAIDLVNRGDS